MTDNTTTATPDRPELAIFDQANRYSRDLRDLDAAQLARQVELAHQAAAMQNGRLDDLRAKIDGIERAHGRGSVPDQMRMQELALKQAQAMAGLQLVEARAEVNRRQREREAAEAQRAELARAQALAAKRAEAWARYQADAGVDLDGTPRADAQAFDRAWAAWLVDLALGTVEL
jgi:hypothetical protein